MFTRLMKPGGIGVFKSLLQNSQLRCSRLSSLNNVLTRSVVTSQRCQRSEVTDEPIKFTTSQAGSPLGSLKAVEPAGNKNSDGFVAFLRGLPFKSTPEDLSKFIGDVNTVGSVKPVLTQNGRPTGKVYVELASQSDLDTVLAKHKQYIGDRYIEVLQSTKGLMERDTEDHIVDIDQDSSIVRLSGLPFNCTKNDIENFLEGIEITPGGIILPSGPDGRNFGFAFIWLKSRAMFIKARLRDKQDMNGRFVDVGRCSIQERNYITKGLMSRLVRLSGIPFQATEQDIIQFLSPLVPKTVMIRFLQSGLPSGHADIEFHSHQDAREALGKDQEYIGNRYVQMYIYHNEEADPEGEHVEAAQ